MPCQTFYIAEDTRIHPGQHRVFMQYERHFSHAPPLEEHGKYHISDDFLFEPNGQTVDSPQMPTIGT